MNIQLAMQFENKLYELINNCGLSVDTAFYVFKSVYLDFQNTLLNCADKDTEYSENQEIIKVNNKEIMENDDTINRDNA